MKLKLLLALLVIGSQSCTKDKTGTETAPVKDSIVVIKPPVTGTDTIPKSNYDLSLLDKTNLFSTSSVVTALKRQDYKELSGIAASQNYAGVLYVHEDSGNSNEVYITNTKGEDLGKVILDGVYNRDWEDIAYGPGPDPSRKYIYVAEIGDNDSKYPSVFVYRFPEPVIDLNSSGNALHVTPDKLQFTYPKGAVNAESLLLDPLTKDLYIATKEQAKSTLYVAKYPQALNASTVLTPLARLPFDLLTSGDISPDGTEILLRNTGQIWYWKRRPNESVAQTILRKPQDAPYSRNEHQGEAVCFAWDGSGYLTTSETKKYPGDFSALSFYQRIKTN
ncbi:hypothetical protein DBR11_12175 [Pedobacter sp. HMWF019]|uniref:hypothetical protein n=1 Tax=Pedobacter sp. HMWF019 TaxID=2056856 RepID=UPI000D3782B7|nr:hypothetical protein [Pedobacter sp. HMWF019]PTS99519.1 hypothetical protein DBR11_12175 [Pedobacter sp. HMWF019]